MVERIHAMHPYEMDIEMIVAALFLRAVDSTKGTAGGPA